ncbi:hypothetical protein BDV96DRAFT_694595 [Lophiotrema nucula]|uniref:Glycosyl transferase CAP10 domain-containing protein n=1 Tax=Lophiotrema nucula TaxID=690887 RepID=A0A6A5YFH2_9PLEO|nr:hypothetical protein BDV96DRAFT_694595 [Lophiotrema nucula]
MVPKWLFPCGLVVGTSYLTATVDTSFALDRPLHTAATLLLLTGLTFAACQAVLTWRHPAPVQENYMLISLNNDDDDDDDESLADDPLPSGRPSAAYPISGTRLGLLAVLVLAICARATLFWRIMKGVECATTSPLVFLPLAVALFHTALNRRSIIALYNPQNTHLKSILDFMVHAAFRGSTRYILPALFLCASGFLIDWQANLLRSSYICPITTGGVRLIPRLQWVGLMVDCVIVFLLYTLFDARWTSERDRSPSVTGYDNHLLLVGLAFCISAAILVLSGIVVYIAQKHHRTWLLDFPPEYLHHLLRFCIMIPCMTICVLVIIRKYSFVSAVMMTGLTSILINSLRTFMAGVTVAILPKSTVEPWTSSILLVVALTLYFVAERDIEGRSLLPRMSMRNGKYQAMLYVLLVLTLVLGGTRYRHSLVRSSTGSQHPIATLLKDADIYAETWARQAKRSRTLAEAVTNYQYRYHRDPPPGFDKWYEFATSRNSAILDDFDNIEEDLAPFSSFTPQALREKTAELLAEGSLAGIKIRDGKMEVSGNALASHRWMLDGTIGMINKFAEHLPDMDLAINLNDEPRVTVPFLEMQEAQTNKQIYEYGTRRGNIDWTPNRGASWIDVDQMPARPPHFAGTGFNPTFQKHGSVACSSGSPARKQRRWDTGALCASCAEPHSIGLFVSNWSISSEPCHQPDLANLHGLHLSPSALVVTHDLVPVFSQSKPPGYADIRYPSPWNYMDRAKYEFDEMHPDPTFSKKENVLFWRGATTEGVSVNGEWRGMLRQRLVHLANNETRHQLMFLPASESNPSTFDYILKDIQGLKRELNTKLDTSFVEVATHCGDPDCPTQKAEFALAEKVDFRNHWRYKYLFDMDGAGFSGRFIPFLQSNSVVFKTALFRQWYEGRLTAWKHFVPVDLRLHDLFSSLAYFGGYGGNEDGFWDSHDGKNTVDAGAVYVKGVGWRRWIKAREKEAEKIARESRVWAEKVLRKEDMEIYMFRLLLEWGRLTDERRTEAGFRIAPKVKDKGGRADVKEKEERADVQVEL